MSECGAISVDAGGSDWARASAVMRLSGVVERSTSAAASDISINPQAGAIRPVHRTEETIQSKITRPRDEGSEQDRGGSALPCHSHKPGSWLSAPTDFVSGSTIAPVVVQFNGVLHPSPAHGRGRNRENEKRAVKDPESEGRAAVRAAAGGTQKMSAAVRTHQEISYRMRPVWPVTGSANRNPRPGRSSPGARRGVRGDLGVPPEKAFN
jgi:hypothetical protein